MNPSSRCGCGHIKMHHGTGRYGLDCAVVGCQCGAFVEYVEQREPRAKPVRTLDREDPKMFEVA